MTVGFNTSNSQLGNIILVKMVAGSLEGTNINIASGIYAANLTAYCGAITPKETFSILRSDS